MSHFSCLQHVSNPKWAYFFKDDYYVIVEWDPDGTDQSIIVGPNIIADDWQAFDDTGFSFINSLLIRDIIEGYEAFAFSDDRYGVVKINQDGTSRIMGCSKPLKNGWPPLKEAGFSMVSAAYPVPGNDEQVYFFSDKDCVTVEYNIFHEIIIKGPDKIVDAWPSLKSAGFEVVDAVLPRPDDPSVAYFFSGSNYAVVQIVPGTSYDKVIKGPEPIADGWPALKEAGFF